MSWLALQPAGAVVCDGAWSVALVRGACAALLVSARAFQRARTNQAAAAARCFWGEGGACNAWRRHVQGGGLHCLVSFSCVCIGVASLFVVVASTGAASWRLAVSRWHRCGSTQAGVAPAARCCLGHMITLKLQQSHPFATARPGGACAAETYVSACRHADTVLLEGGVLQTVCARLLQLLRRRPSVSVAAAGDRASAWLPLSQQRQQQSADSPTPAGPCCTAAGVLIGEMGLSRTPVGWPTTSAQRLGSRKAFNALLCRCTPSSLAPTPSTFPAAPLVAQACQDARDQPQRCGVSRGRPRALRVPELWSRPSAAAAGQRGSP